MGYVFPTDAIAKLRQLRKNYEEREGIDLEQKPGFFGWPMLLGGTDISSRSQQLLFIEKIMAVLQPNLKDDEEITSQPQYEAKYTACKMTVAACLYIQSQIYPTYKARSAKNSDLYWLIDEALGLQAYNRMSKEDKIECYNTATRLMKIAGAFEEANTSLAKAGLPPLTEKEWNEFESFVNKRSQISKSDYDFENWPCTSISKPLFGYIGSTIGMTSGILTANLFNSSSHLLPTHHYAAATVGNGIILLGIGSTLGAPFIAPIIASKLLDTFLQVFLAKSLHYAMQFFGEGIGVAIGVPLDYAYHFLCQIYHSLYEYRGEKPAGLTGLRIIDGKQMVRGLIVESKPVKEEELTAGQKESAVFINKDGSFTIGKQTFNISEYMPAVIGELKKKLEEGPRDSEETEAGDSLAYG